MPKPNEDTTPTSTPTLSASGVEETEDGVYFVIGGEKILVPPLYFWSIKRCWQDIGLASVSPDPVVRIDSLLKIIESSLANSDNPIPLDQLSRKLRTNEWKGLTEAYPYLLVHSGFLTREDLERRQREEAENQHLGEDSLQGQDPSAREVSASSTRSSNGLASYGSSETETETETGIGSGIRTVRGPTSIQ